MRKMQISLVIFFLSFCLVLNGQYFSGGNFGFNSHNSKTSEFGAVTREVSNYSFSLAPQAGKFLSEKVAIGLALGFSLNGNSSVGATETLNRSSSFGIYPFLRYYSISWNKFSIFLEGKAGLQFSGSKRKTGGVTDDGPHETSLSFNIYPGLSYNLSEKLSLETSLQILSVGYVYETSKEGTTRNNSSGFAAGAGLGNILSVNALVIGAIYKF